MEILIAIDRLDNLVHEARPIPLTDQVRMEKRELLEAVSAIREHAEQLRSSEEIEALEAMAASAKRILGSEQVRLDREDMYDQLDLLRASIKPSSPYEPSPWNPVLKIYDELHGLVYAASRTPFTRSLKFDAGALRHVAGRMRTAAPQNVGPGSAFYAVLDELDALARTDGTVKVRADDMFDLLERMLFSMG